MNVKHTYLHNLDGLRFYSIAMVAICHWWQWQTKEGSIASKLPFASGVFLFYVLSGFLITHILILQKQDDSTTLFQKLKTFYIRRFLRIFPLYYLVIIFLFIINYKNTREVFWWLSTYTSNILEGIIKGNIGDYCHFWSLAVEEHFYLIWPFIILFTPTQYIFNALIITIVLALSSKSFIFYYTEHWIPAHKFSPSNFCAFALGAIISYSLLFKSRWYYFISNYKFLLITILMYLIYFFSELNHKIHYVISTLFGDFVFCLFAMALVAYLSN